MVLVPKSPGRVARVDVRIGMVVEDDVLPLWSRKITKKGIVKPKPIMLGIHSVGTREKTV